VDTWVVGLVALCVVGLAVITYGALRDRRTNRRREAAMLSAPTRDIPQFSPAATRPQYLSELMARRSPSSTVTGLTAADRATVATQQESGTTIAAGYASKDFATDPPTGWAVLDHPRVLVCAEAPGSVRELIGVLEKVALAGVPLVIAAPSVPKEVLGTLEVNRIQHRMQVLALTSNDPAVIDQVVAATGSRLVSRIDLQASYVTDADLGRCERWVSDRTRSWVIGGTP
jgi:hypothetical protein